jgi:hypothetical protein
MRTRPYHISKIRPFVFDPTTQDPLTYALKDDGHLYEIDHHENGFYMLSNNNAANKRILFSKEIPKELESCSEVIAHDSNTLLEGLSVFKNFLLIEERTNGLRKLKVKNIAALAEAGQEVQRLFGVTGRSGELLGLDADWGARVIRQVGNYREVWERNIQPLGLQRGLNLLWNQGGLQYAPPIR